MRRLDAETIQRGFTIIELMVTVVVLAVVASLSAPAMRNFITEQRLKAAFSDFQRGLNLARAEAIRRNARVTFAAADCANFSSGWKVFVETGLNADRCHNGAEPLVMRGDPIDNAIRVTWVNADGNQPYLMFTPTGTVALSNGAVGASRFSLDVPSSPAIQARTLCINFYGRTRPLLGSTNCGTMG
ncbi:MAG: GspH/FimT family pseudopilin [Casimicrobiaceae bacterium]|nr:GspH/FimT family pseudopilin [Casimicrobiaceae bacterium]